MSMGTLVLPSPADLAEECEYDQEKEIAAIFHISSPNLPGGELSGS